MRALVAIIDGLGVDYYLRHKRDLPWELERFAALRPVFGYSLTAYCSAATGLSPDRTGVFTEYRREEGDGRVHPLDFLRLIPGLRLRMLIKGYAFSFLQHLRLQPDDLAGIPPGFRSRFEAWHSDYGSFPPVLKLANRSIISALSAVGVDARYTRMTSLGRSAYAAASSRLAGADIGLIYFPQFDSIGHRKGLDSNDAAECLASIWETIGRFRRDLSSEPSVPVPLLVFSDHGMVPVARRFDFLGVLENHGFVYGRDYLAFVNSTICSIWYTNPAPQLRLRTVLSDSGVGRFLTDSQKADLGVAFRNHEYGEDLFVCDPGTEILPNFVSPFTRMSMAMHGYLPDAEAQLAVVGLSGLKGPMPTTIMQIHDFLAAFADSSV